MSQTQRYHRVETSERNYSLDNCEFCKCERPDLKNWTRKIYPLNDSEHFLRGTLCDKCCECIANGNAIFFCNVYLGDRAFGGPEEGGWWYDYETIEAVYPTDNLESAQKLKKWLKENEYSNDGRHPVSSVLSDGEYVVRIEFRPGQNSPDRKPHYE